MKKVFALILLIVMLSGCSPFKPDPTSVNSRYDDYEGTIRGSDVTWAVGMNLTSDVSIYIRTGVNKEGFYGQTKGCYTVKDGVAEPTTGCRYYSQSEILNSSDPNHHVNTSVSFKATQFKDKDGVVRVILMEQQ